MQNLHGIAVTDDGQFVMATLRRGGGSGVTGQWRVTRVAFWESQNTFRNLLLLGRGVVLGLPSHWARREKLGSENLTIAPEGSDYAVCTASQEYQIHCTSLESNLSGTVPDDAFLCTIPLHFGTNGVDSFVAIHRGMQVLKIGITINRQLRLVFNFPPADSERLECCVGRIARYWRSCFPEIPFPSRVYFLEPTQSAATVPDFECLNISLPFEKHPENSHAVLRAVGTALCAPDTSVPRFDGPSAASVFRKFRTTAYAISVLLVIAAIGIMALGESTRFYYARALQNSKREYQLVLSENGEIRQLLESSKQLSDKVLRLKRMSSSTTRWAQFLQDLGTRRPDGLAFERLGSDVLAGKSSQARIALAGWAENETLVTALIKQLEAMPALSDIALSSLERDDKNKSICRFKILCTLRLSDG